MGVSNGLGVAEKSRVCCTRAQNRGMSTVCGQSGFMEEAICIVSVIWVIGALTTNMDQKCIQWIDCIGFKKKAADYWAHFTNRFLSGSGTLRIIVYQFSFSAELASAERFVSRFLCRCWGSSIIVREALSIHFHVCVYHLHQFLDVVPGCHRNLDFYLLFYVGLDVVPLSINTACSCTTETG